MLIGIHDYDIKKNKPFVPNIQAMKISGYYKNNRHIVELLTRGDLKESYDKLYFFRNKKNKYKHLRLWEKENATCFGKEFSNSYIPLPEEMEKIKPDITLYSKYFRRAFLDLDMTDQTIASYLNSIDYIQLYTINSVFDFSYHIPKPRCFLYDEYLPDTIEIMEAVQTLSENYKKVRALNNILLDNEEQYWKIPQDTFSFRSHYSFVIPITKTYSEYKDFIKICKDNKIRKMPMIYWGIHEKDHYNDLFMAQEFISTMNKGFLAYSNNLLPKFKYKANDINNQYYGTFIKVDSYFNHDNTGKSFFDFLEPFRRKKLFPLLEIPFYGQTIKKLIHYKPQKNQGGWNYNGC